LHYSTDKANGGKDGTDYYFRLSDTFLGNNIDSDFKESKFFFKNFICVNAFLKFI